MDISHIDEKQHLLTWVDCRIIYLPPTLILTLDL